MRNKYIAPAYKAPRFNCPHCSTLASMDWHVLPPINKTLINAGVPSFWSSAVCVACGEQSLWMTKSSAPAAEALAGVLEMCYPVSLQGPPPSEDMPEDVITDYQEARTVAASSARAAAALLRLSVQKLCKGLGESGKNINDDIAALIKKGLTPLAQQALDTVRIVGNNAVHPLEMTAEDVEKAVPVLFELVNFIVEDLIIRPKLIEAAYQATPQSARDAVAKRDATKK